MAKRSEGGLQVTLLAGLFAALLAAFPVPAGAEGAERADPPAKAAKVSPYARLARQQAGGKAVRVGQAARLHRASARGHR
jgi:hypothetical protein